VARILSRSRSACWMHHEVTEATPGSCRIRPGDDADAPSLTRRVLSPPQLPSGVTE
jgi:hypothetical protein